MNNPHAFDLALLLFRFAIGGVFIAHGINHIIGGGKIAGTGRWFESLGMKRSAKGPRRMIEEDGRIPLLDVGTVAKIRAGAIKVRGAIDRVTPDGVVFSETGPEAFDAIILATGFRPDLRALLPDAANVLDPAGKPLVSGEPTSAPGLFFCGAIASPTGQLREIGIEAERIAKLAKGILADRSSTTTLTSVATPPSPLGATTIAR